MQEAPEYALGSDAFRQILQSIFQKPQALMDMVQSGSQIERKILNKEPSYRIYIKRVSKLLAYQYVI